MTGYAALAHPWWIPLAWILVVGHITNICNTLYLHRSVTHGGVDFHPVAEHFMRFWIWLTTGIVTREWVAVHRKHHAFSDRDGDPHSPEVEGFWAIVLGGLFFYRKASRDPELLEKYGKGCPEDWVERNVYSRFRTVGIGLMLALSVWLFGIWIGLLVWSTMAIWMPIMGNIVNGIGHAKGYRNFETKDHSHNIYPWGIWILGEELHNNHHADPRSAKFKAHWWEFDIGWVYIRLLSFLGLADVVYAREASVEEFAARHYGRRKTADEAGAAAGAPATAATGSGSLTDAGGWRPSVAGGEEAGRAAAAAAARAARARLDAVREGARDEMTQAKRRLGEAAANARDGAREEMAQAKRKLGEAAANARASLERSEPAPE